MDQGPQEGHRGAGKLQGHSPSRLCWCLFQSGRNAFWRPWVSRSLCQALTVVGCQPIPSTSPPCLWLDLMLLVFQGWGFSLAPVSTQISLSCWGLYPGRKPAFPFDLSGGQPQTSALSGIPWPKKLVSVAVSPCLAPGIIL